MTTFFNDVKFKSTTTGTADFGIGAAVNAFQLPAAAGAVDGNQHSYSARNAQQFESGLGQYDATNNRWKRISVDDSSIGSGSKVDFNSPPIVALVVLARDLANFGSGGGTTQTYAGTYPYLGF